MTVIETLRHYFFRGDPVAAKTERRRQKVAEATEKLRNDAAEIKQLVEQQIEESNDPFWEFAKEMRRKRQ